jgi:D-alanine-D-alanine ligase
MLGQPGSTQQMKIGIFFGGPAREREISFAGGKTACEHLDKSLFDAVPVFVDRDGNFILLRPELLYAASIRDFYPPPHLVEGAWPFRVYVESLEALDAEAQAAMMAQIGRRIFPHEFTQHFDFAFIAMHGPACEDGSIQGLLEWYRIPYSGPGLLGSSVGIDKIAQNDLLRLSVGLDKATLTLTKDEWRRFSHATLFDQIKRDVGLPFVVKAPHQGSSIGVSFVKIDDLEAFETAVEQCFFIVKIPQNLWKNASDDQKGALLQSIANLDEGIGFPVVFNGNEVIKHPQKLWQKLDTYFQHPFAEAVLSSTDSEDAVLIEGFVAGQEFSCGVIQEPDGRAVALPPTEIVKVVEVFDFKSKYQPGATRKRLPIQTSLDNLRAVQAAVQKAFEQLRFGVCTRIDGFLTADNRVILHDPNTIPGMSPTSLIFKQMAEIGLSVADSITYFVRNSLRERIRSGKNTHQLEVQLQALDERIADRLAGYSNRPQVAIVFGQTTDLDASYAQARRVFGQVAASATHRPLAVLKQGDTWWQLPLQAMFRDYFEDLEVLLDAPVHPLIAETRANARVITAFFAGDFQENFQETTPEQLSQTCQALWTDLDISMDLPRYEVG